MSKIPNPKKIVTLFALAVGLTIASYNNCKASIFSRYNLPNILVAGDTVLLNIPNVFTPDGDGINDYFTINNIGLKEYKIQIYDRWGLLVFESESPLVDWDGRSTSGVIMSEGTYFFILKAISFNSVDYSTTGFLSLFRGK